MLLFVGWAKILLDVGPATIPVSVLNASWGEMQVFINWKEVEKIAALVLKSFKGDGSAGKAMSRATSAERETFAEIKDNGPIVGRLVVLLPQFACTLVESFASRRGKVMETVAWALIFDSNSNPTGIEGLKARLRRMSTLVRFAVIGRGVSDDPGKPMMLLFVRSAKSTRTLESFGI